MELNKKTKYCYIVTEDGHYFRPKGFGVTEDHNRAHAFLWKDGEQMANADPRACKLMPIDIQEHNSRILNQVMQLEQSLVDQPLVRLRLDPFTALTVHGVTEMVKGRLKDIPKCERIVQALDDYEKELVQKISKEDIEEASVEKEIFKAFNDIDEE